MATTIEKKMMTQLDELYANESKLNREIASYNNQLVDDDLKEHDRIATEKFLSAAEVNLASNNHKIEQLNGHVLELQSKEKEANEHQWKDLVKLIDDSVRKHHMSYCVESNKFIYCMDMASQIKDDTGNDYVVVNPQFRSFEASRAERVIGKLIGKFMSDSNYKIIKWFMTNQNVTHFQETASFLYTKWSSDKVYNKARVISNFWVEPNFKEYQSYNKDFDILLYCVSGGKQENIDHLEIWPVYKFLFPERVANTPNLDICGPTGANGKGRYLEMNKTIFTHGCVNPAAAKELSDGFNASWEMSTIIYFDEPGEKELPVGKVKNATGGEEQRVERKGIDAYTADRNFSIVALSNNEQGVFRLSGSGMAGQDRRYSVVATDIVLIDELMLRENITKEQASNRANQIAQLVKDRNEIAKWMAHVIIKHNVNDMSILNALHGKDYQERFEDQKTDMDRIFDKLFEVLKQNGMLPVEFIVQTLNSLLTTDKKKVDLPPKTVSKKFDTYLHKKKTDHCLVQRVRPRILFNGEETDILGQKSVFYYKKDMLIDDFEFSLLSDRIYSSEFGLTKDRLTITKD